MQIIHQFQKDQAWKEFVELPLYEDMAPWNIVYQGNKLKYIDYDSQDKIYTQHLQFIYRVLAALINYKRTVEDFERCEKTGILSINSDRNEQCL